MAVPASGMPCQAGTTRWRASHGPADAPGLHPGYDRVEVACFQTVPVSVTRGQEHSRSSGQDRVAKSDVGRRPHLHLAYFAVLLDRTRAF